MPGIRKQKRSGATKSLNAVKATIHKVSNPIFANAKMIKAKRKLCCGANLNLPEQQSAFCRDYSQILEKRQKKMEAWIGVEPIYAILQTAA